MYLNMWRWNCDQRWRMW